MSYRNPQRNIDNKYAVMTEGINQYYTNLQNVLTKAAKGKEEYKKKQMEAEKAFQKDIDKKLSPFDKQVEGKIEEIQKALGEDNTNKGLYEDLISELEYVRKALAYQLRDQDLTTSEIAFKVEAAGNNVNQLTQALVNLSAAEGQYSNATSKKPNEEGYLLSGGPNQELAQIIKNVDSGKGSATLHNDNRTELSEYKFNGNYSLVDYASGSIENGQPKEGAIPEGVFDLSSQELTQAVTNGENLFNTVKVIEPGIQEAFNTSVSEMIKADPTLVGTNGKIDQIKLKEKLSTSEGREHIESITKIDGNDVTRNYWRSIAPDSVTDFENWDSYANEDIFTNYLIEQAAGSEPVKGTVLEFEERQKVESPQMSKVEDVVEAGK
jgi:archaellum component FlaC